jgi:ADP-ribose pyrophosphatase YjhB (NUDIX family)
LDTRQTQGKPSDSEGTEPELSIKGAATLALIQKDNQVLLVATRWADAGIWWQLPGGSVLHGQSLADALRQQLMDEAGLDTIVDDLLFVMEIEDHLIFVFGARISSADTIQAAKVDCCFVPIDQLTAFPRLIGREPLLEWLRQSTGRRRYYRMTQGRAWL